MPNQKTTYIELENQIAELKKQNQLLQLNIACQNEAKNNKELILLKSIIESQIEIIIFSLDKNYCYTSFSNFHKKTIKKIWGIDIQIGMNMLHVISILQDREKAKRNFDKALKGENFILTEDYGEEMLYRTYYDNYYSPVKDVENDIIGVSVFVIDVTARKQIENELIFSKEKAEENELKYRTLYENSSSGILVINPENASFIEFNDQVCKQLGYTREEFAKLTIADIEALETIEETKQRIKQILEIGSADFETKQKTKQGEIRNILVSARIIEISNKIYYHCIFRDITDSKRNEKELIKAKEKAEESNANIQAIIENSVNSIWATNLNCELTYINQVFKDEYYISFGVELGIGSNVVTTLPIAIQSIWKDRYNRVFNNEHLTLEDKVEVAPNMYVYINVTMTPIISKGKIIGASIFGSNITERKQQEQELILAKEKAEESDRLKTAFLQNMSHEIRTPLNAISGFSGMLNKANLMEEKRNSFVKIIQNSSNQLISIVSDILTISSLETKQEKLNITKVSINNIILDLLTIFKQQATNQNISLYAKKQLNDVQSEIYTDKTKITQIVTNLLANALKFTHKGSIEFGYDISETQGLASLKFYVKDTGIGIKPELHKIIFERFSQGEKNIQANYGGTGLGLSISQGFIGLLGGKIWVESELEKGSTFYFTIPYTPVHEIDKIDSTIVRNENFRTILVAEDEEYNFLFIEELLIDMDLKLIHTKNGKETVDVCKENSKIDLILMDIKMPVMDGFTATKLIKEFRADLPIIAQSAYALEHELEKFSGIFDDYITKPMSEMELKQKVLKYIDIQRNKSSI